MGWHGEPHKISFNDNGDWIKIKYLKNAMGYCRIKIYSNRLYESSGYKNNLFFEIRVAANLNILSWPFSKSHILIDAIKRFLRIDNVDNSSLVAKKMFYLFHT